MRNVIILLFSILLLTSQVFGFTISNPASSGSGSGDVSVSGTPVANDIAQWTSATAIKGMTYAELAAIAGFESALEAVLDVADLQGFAAVLTAAEIGAAYDTEAELNALFAAKEDQLNNEAGLYAVLSDVTNFLQTGDTVDDDDVAFDDANGDWTATDLGSALEEMVAEINSGDPNSATAKVHWSQLTGVPAGFADGTDADSGGTPAVVTLSDNESTNENNPIWFSAGAAGSGDVAPEADGGDFYYNPSTGVLHVAGGVEVPANSTAAQYNEYYEDTDDGGNKVTVTAQAMASDRTITYPDASGTFLLEDGTGASLTAVDAVTGDSATAFFDAGTIEHERGGLEADVNAYSGLVAISGGSTSEVDAKSELESQIADVSDFAEADGDAYTGTHDFGDADDLEIPNGNNPTTDTEGQVAHDTDDGALEVYSSKFSASVLTAPEEITLPAIIIYEPDEVATIEDEVVLYHFVAETYPHGVTIRSIHIAATATCTDPLNFEEWTNNGTAWSNDATVEAITLSGTYTEDDGTLTDASMAADSYLMVDLDDTMDDIAYLAITVTITINPGD